MFSDVGEGSQGYFN